MAQFSWDETHNADGFDFTRVDGETFHLSLKADEQGHFRRTTAGRTPWHQVFDAHIRDMPGHAREVVATITPEVMDNANLATA